MINPYLSFNGNCREAMNFYKDCFGGELDLMLVKDTPAAERCPAGMLDQVMHASLSNKGLVLMGSDMVRPEGFQEGNNFAVSVNCETEEEINRLYRQLSEAGKIVESLHQQFWGAMFAVVVDRFNIPWMLNYQMK